MFGPASADYATVATALESKLGTITNSVEVAYVLISGTPSVAVTNGNLVITINLRLPYVAVADLASAISGAFDGNVIIESTTSVTGAVITDLANISNATGTVGATYTNTGTRRITLTINAAAGRQFDTTANAYTTGAGANNILNALDTKLGSGTITNSVAATYTLISSTTVQTVTATTMTVYINLAVNNITADELAALITGVVGGDLAVAANNSVTGALVTGLTGVSGITGNVTVAYSTSNKRITFTIPAATGRAFSTTANFYTTTAGANNISTLLNGKLGAITNDVDPTYTIKTSAAPTVSAVAATMTIYFTLQQDFVAASDLEAAIDDAANGDLVVVSGDSVTGALVSALTILNVTGTVTASYDDYKITLTVPPVATKAFNTTASTYSSVATALAGKLGSITNSVDASYVTVSGDPELSVSGGNLVIDIALEE
jgi:hypothetical protein